ncbi:DUF4998 domain-containing protein [Chitinophaga deserti]|uniref:DUF4998 domain-containing protein n=1 Tax=Chitinophaga deserti TaxID=2164099 RepID=UPI0018E5A6C4|nr:DUF4998 domain-containing protein [Chitinophaga deserti]
MKDLLIKSILGIFVLAAASCTKTSGDAFKDFMKGGEIIYPGRADTVLVHPGQNRIKLRVVLGNDPLVTQLRVFWSNKADSLTVPVKRTSGRDTVEVMIPNLKEGNYNFTIHTYDSEGHISVVVNAFGITYGANYASSLVNRTLKSIEQSTDGSQIILNWGEPAGGELGIEVKYKGVDGLEKTITVQPGDLVTTLPDYESKSLLSYRSQYKPDSMAFEYFYPPVSTATLPVFERQLSKAGFSVLELPGDVKSNHGWLMHYLWDDNINSGFATQNVVPCWFTIDAGQTASLGRIKFWQATDRLYRIENVKTFELYGSNNPAPDGSWASWTQIGAFSSVKPSGKPVGENTQEDIDYALAGESFPLAEGTPKFRYYRFKLLTNWGGSAFMTMGEISLFTHDR